MNTTLSKQICIGLKKKQKNLETKKSNTSLKHYQKTLIFTKKKKNNHHNLPRTKEILNKQSELISKGRHKNKFQLNHLKNNELKDKNK